VYGVSAFREEERMTEQEVEEVYAFTAKVLYSLQEQINEMTRTDLALVMKVKALEEANLWNIMQGNLEQTPDDTFVVRAADGKLAMKPRKEEEEDGATV
jgi:hypothetical protein